jgi:hypothetical protein
MHFDFPAGRVGGFGVHGSTGGATGAGFGLLYFDWRACALRTSVAARSGRHVPGRGHEQVAAPLPCKAVVAKGLRAGVMEPSGPKRQGEQNRGKVSKIEATALVDWQGPPGAFA